MERETVRDQVRRIAEEARAASGALAQTSADERNGALASMAAALRSHAAAIVEANGCDKMCIRDSIEGAHEGRGLGHEFLRHIERTALIVHVVDLTGDYEGRDPLEDYDIINRELALYADELAARPRIVVANKIDVPGAEEVADRLAERVREDSIAAAGGDEFASSPVDPKLYRCLLYTSRCV